MVGASTLSPTVHATIPGPNLKASITNNTNDAAVLGDTFVWTLTVSNAGGADATFSDGQTVVADDLPTGAVSYGDPTSSDPGVACAINSNTLICSASGTVTIPASTSIAITLPVTPTASGQLLNPPIGGSCKVDPANVVSEVDDDVDNEGDNACRPDGVTTTSPDLTVVTGNDVGGMSLIDGTWIWSWTIFNKDTGPAIFTDGRIILVGNLPETGLTYGTPTVGSGTIGVTNGLNVNCAITNSTLTCAASGASVEIGGPTGRLVINVPVRPTGAGTFDNPRQGGSCSVDPGFKVAESKEGNNACSPDSVTVTAPDLQISKANNVGGATAVGSTFSWTVTVANVGVGDATFADGQTILTDNLPAAGLTYGAPTTENVVNVGGDSGIVCAVAGNDLTCTASGSNVVIGSTTGTFTVSVPVTTTTAGSFVNPRADGICRVDPNRVVAEGTESNNDCTDTVSVTQANLQVAQVASSGPTAVVQQPITWTWTITNAGNGPASFGPKKAILRANLPDVGGTYATPAVKNPFTVDGSNRITCVVANDDLACTVNEGFVVTIAPGGHFDVELAFTANVAGTLTSPREGGACTVDPDNVVAESSEADNACSDNITVRGPDLRVSKTNSVGGAATVGTPWTWTWTVTNTGTYGATFESSREILFDNLPKDATYGEVKVINPANVDGPGQINCEITNDDLVCLASGGAVTLGEATGAFTVTATVTPHGAGMYQNPRPSSGVCQVDRNNEAKELDETNNGCSDSVTVTIAPIDLQLSATNNVGGTVTVGSPFIWSIKLANLASGGAFFPGGQTILKDDLPNSGVSYAAVNVVDVTNVTNRDDIHCAIASGTLTCMAGGDGVTIGGTTGTFTVTVEVTPTATGSLANPRSGGVCRVDPASGIAETNEANNDCADTVTVTQPDLKVTASNSVGGTANLGVPFQWTLTVTNAGSGPATFSAAQSILHDDLPSSGATYDPPTKASATGITNSDNITCAIVASVLDCTASGSVTIGAGGQLTIQVATTPTTLGALANPKSGGSCAVDPGNVVGEGNESDNGCSDSVTVVGSDLQVVKKNDVSGAALVGSPWTWTWTVSNTGSGSATFADGQSILLDNLPNSGLSYTAPVVTDPVNVTGPGQVDCSIDGSDLTCRARDGSVAIGATTGRFTVSVSVTPTAPGAYTNPRAGGKCQVDPASLVVEVDESNNTCTDAVTVTLPPQPDLRVTLTNSTSSVAAIDDLFSWSWSVTNTDTGIATFAPGQTILTDDLPASGVTFGEPFVTSSVTDVTGSNNIVCAIAASTLTCKATGGAVSIGANGGTFSVFLAATPTAAGTLEHPRAGGMCKVDPDSNVAERDETNNACTDTVTVEGPDLRIDATNNASAPVQAGTPFTVTLVARNTGGAPARFGAGQTIFADDLPTSGFIYANAVAQTTGVTGQVECSLDADLAQCRARADNAVQIDPNGTVTYTFDVTPISNVTYTNPRATGACLVDPLNVVTESNEANNTCADTVAVSGTFDLSVSNANSVAGAAIVGTPFSWTLTVTNPGGSPVTFTSGQTILTDDLPSAGATYGTPTVGSLVGITNSDNIACAIAANTLTCSANGGPVKLGATTGSFTVTVPVTPTVVGTLLNPRAGGTCQVDPASLIPETNESNNGCTNSVTVAAAGQPDLRVTATDNVGGSTTVGTGFVWTLTVANTGGASATFANGQTILADNLPNGGATYGSPTVTNVTGVSNSGNIACAIVANDLTCSASGNSVALAPSGTFAVNVPVSPNVAGTLTNPRTGGLCTVDPSTVVAEGNEGNNTCIASVNVANLTVVPPAQPDLQVSAATSAGGAVTLGSPFSLTLTVSNGGNGAATFVDGQTVLTDALPTSATYGTPTITNVGNVSSSGNLRCTIANSVLTCTATGASVAIGPSGTFQVGIPVTPTIGGPFVNPRPGGTCAVDPNAVIAETNEGNNTCAGSLTVSVESPPTLPPDLQATLTNSVGGSVAVGSPWDWALTVRNTGGSAATFQAGQTIVADSLPSSDVTYGAPTVGGVAGISGSGSVSCAVATSTLTCVAGGGSVTLDPATGAFTVTVRATSTVVGTYASPGSGSCAVDPHSVVIESNKGNNGCGNTVTVRRPTVGVTSVRSGPGTLVVTVTAVGAGNTLREIQVGEMTNATVQVAGETVSSGTRLPLPSGPTTLTITITKTTPGAATHVPLVVVDQYGEWPTFVGGGANAF